MSKTLIFKPSLVESYRKGIKILRNVNHIEILFIVYQKKGRCNVYDYRDDLQVSKQTLSRRLAEMVRLRVITHSRKRYWMTSEQRDYAREILTTVTQLGLTATVRFDY